MFYKYSPYFVSLKGENSLEKTLSLWVLCGGLYEIRLNDILYRTGSDQFGPPTRGQALCHSKY